MPAHEVQHCNKYRPDADIKNEYSRDEHWDTIRYDTGNLTQNAVTPVVPMSTQNSEYSKYEPRDAYLK
jgi:hypothetical protein